MPKLTDATWSDIRREWEAGRSQNSLAKEYGVALTTIVNHRKKDGWVRPDSEEAESVNDAVVESDPFDDPAEALRAALAAQEAKVAELEKELQQFKPTEVEWPWDIPTAAKLLAGQMDEMIQAELIEVNKARLKNGFPPVTGVDMGSAWYEAQEKRIIADTVSGLTASATNTGPALRTRAMRKPNGSIVQVPLSASIGGGPDALVASLKAKGYKDLTPQPCVRMDCWLEGKAEFFGYCGQLHMSLDPYAGRSQQVVTATTTADFGVR